MKKIQLYLNKINTSNKKNKYIAKILNLHGGFKFNTQDTIQNNASELFNYIDQSYIQKVKKVTKDKYFVILMGPPGTGKSFARKFAVKYICKYIEINNLYDITYNSFVDISVDNYVNDIEVNNDKAGKDRFMDIKENLNEKSADDYAQIAQKSYDIYQSMRLLVDPVSEIMISVCIYLGINIFFETIGANPQYIESLINNICKYYKYIPIIIYPVITSQEEHISRLKKRGSAEGRVVDINYAINITHKCNYSYEKIKFKMYNIMISANNTNGLKKAYIIKFANDKPQPEINNYDLSEFTPINHNAYTSELIDKNDIISYTVNNVTTIPNMS